MSRSATSCSGISSKASPFLETGKSISTKTPPASASR
jgi:hypothetical protein